MEFRSGLIVMLLAFATGLCLGYGVRATEEGARATVGVGGTVVEPDLPPPSTQRAMGAVDTGEQAAPRKASTRPTQAYIDARSGAKIVRVGIQKTDCGCCQALQEKLADQGFFAKLDDPSRSSALQLNEHDDRCRVVMVDGVTFTGYDTNELARIVAMKMRGDLPEHLSFNKRYRGVDPRQAVPLHNERTLLVMEEARDRL